MTGTASKRQTGSWRMQVPGPERMASIAIDPGDQPRTREGHHRHSRERGCDLIAMASHRREGFTRIHGRQRDDEGARPFKDPGSGLPVMRPGACGSGASLGALCMFAFD
ncbi:hypothetical protein [Rhizobium yanglingense]